MNSKKSMTLGLLTGLTLTLAALPAFAKEGTNTGGGGDASEKRVDEIRGDILKWISEGGATGLRFPAPIPYHFYQSSMSARLEPHAVVVGFVTTEQEKNSSDPELNVIVNGQPKTCRGFISNRDHLQHILCNTERFAAISEADQYSLVHHEYAGLSGVEQNIGASSDYVISNQITAYLTQQTVLKLSIKPHMTPEKREEIAIKIVKKTFEKADALATIYDIANPKVEAEMRIELEAWYMSPGITGIFMPSRCGSENGSQLDAVSCVRVKYKYYFDARSKWIKAQLNQWWAKIKSTVPADNDLLAKADRWISNINPDGEISDNRRVSPHSTSTFAFGTIEDVYFDPKSGIRLLSSYDGEQRHRANEIDLYAPKIAAKEFLAIEGI
ncbi:hypothetical protein WDW37_21275 [Bdellovibrionota bacterium FG-1]